MRYKEHVVNTSSFLQTPIVPRYSNLLELAIFKHYSKNLLVGTIIAFLHFQDS